MHEIGVTVGEIKDAQVAATAPEKQKSNRAA